MQQRIRIDPETAYNYLGSNRVKWEGPGHQVWMDGYVDARDNEAIMSAYKGTLEARSSIFMPSNQLEFGYSQAVSGNSPDPIPPDFVMFKDRANNAPFKKRRLSGEIVFAPYEVGELRLSYSYGEVRTPINKIKINSRLRNFMSYPTNVNGTVRNFFPLGGNRYLDIDSMGAVYMAELEDVEFLDPRASFVYLTKPSFWRSYVETEVNKTMVTAALAASNRGQMDLLTYLMELPEAVRGVLNGFKVVAAAAQKHKRGELSISKSYERRKKFLDAQLARDLASIDESRRGASTYRARQLEKARIRRVKSHQRAINGLLDEMNSALASIWMSFRYSIMPQVYSVQDALNLLANLYSEYVTCREYDKLSSPFPIPEGWTKVEVEKLLKCVVKTRFSVEGTLSQRLSRHASANLAVTLFELGKRTFVLDWFLNIGDFLLAALGVNVGEERKTSFSTKMNISFMTTHKTLPGATVRVNGSCYKRIIINANDNIGITWNPELTLFRAIDSVAMIWPVIRSLLIKSK